MSPTVPVSLTQQLASTSKPGESIQFHYQIISPKMKTDFSTWITGSLRNFVLATTSSTSGNYFLAPTLLSRHNIQPPSLENAPAPDNDVTDGKQVN